MNGVGLLKTKESYYLGGFSLDMKSGFGIEIFYSKFIIIFIITSGKL